MKIRTQCTIGIILILFGAAANAQSAPRLDQLAPYDAAYYGEWDQSRAPQGAFPNFDAAMDLWWESLDDILEVRLLKEEVNAQWDRIASGEEWSAVWGERRALIITGFGDNLTKIPSFLYAIETRNPEIAAKFVQTTFDDIVNILPMASVEEDMFRGYIFTSLYLPGRLPGLSLSFLTEGDWLYLSSSKPMLIDALERMEFDDPGLESHPLYLDARENLPGEHISFQFYNFEEMVKTLDDLAASFKAAQPMMSQGDEEKKEQIGDIFELVEKVIDCFRITSSHAAAYHTDANGNDQTRAYTRFAAEYADPTVQEILRREPAPVRWEKYLPRETGSYSTGNILGLPDLWNITHSLIPLLPNGDAIEDLLSLWQEEYGFDIERDVIAWMGDAWAIVRPVIELDAVVPFNRTAAMIEVKDKEKAQNSLSVVETVIKDMLDQFKVPITIETTNHRGVAITTVRPALPVLPLSPSWTLHEDALLITSDAALMRQMLDAAIRGRGGIDRNRYYRDLSGLFAQPFSKASFQDVEADFFAQREAVRRVAALQAAHDPQRNSLPAMLLDRTSYLLGVMQMYKASAKRSIIHEDYMISEKTVLKQDLRAVPSTRNMIRGSYTLGFEPFIAQDARATLDKGDLERATRLYAILAEHRPEHVEYIEGLAKSHHRAGRSLEALDVYDAALAEHPSIPLLAQRETIISTDPETIYHNIQNVAQTHPSIQVDAALFATAIALRENDPDRAMGLLRLLIANHFDSALSKPAHRELYRLEGDMFQDDLVVSQVAQSPLRDGLPDESVWSSLPSYVIEEGEKELRLSAARDANTLYLLLQPPAGEEKRVMFEAESIRVQLNPSRDYVHYYEIHAQRDQSNGNRKTGVPIHPITQGSAGLADTPATPPETTVPFLDLTNMLQEILKDVPELNEHDLELPWLHVDKRDAPSHAEVIFSGLGSGWAVLVKIPLDGLKSADEPLMDVWNFRLEYDVAVEGERRHWDMDFAGLRFE